MWINQKEWKNDLIAEGPSSVTIHIDGSDGYSKDETLTANDNWKKLFRSRHTTITEQK